MLGIAPYPIEIIEVTRAVFIVDTQLENFQWVLILGQVAGHSSSGRLVEGPMRS